MLGGIATYPGLESWLGAFASAALGFFAEPRAEPGGPQPAPNGGFCSSIPVSWVVSRRGCWPITILLHPVPEPRNQMPSKP